MERRYENWYEKWESGMYGLAIDDLVSFYSYFTLVISEIMLLWLHYQSIALPFTILLGVSLVNILATSWLKGRLEGTKMELVVTIVFWAIFIGRFIAGFFFNVVANLILFAIPIVFTAIAIVVRIFQNSKVVEGSKFLMDVSKLFAHPLFWLFTQFIILVLPYWILIWIVLRIPIDSSIIKIGICALYGMFVPYLAYIEDEWGAQNIFELGFSVVWSREREEAIEELNKRYQENPEAVKAEIQEFMNECIRQAEIVDEESSK